MVDDRVHGIHAGAAPAAPRHRAVTNGSRSTAPSRDNIRQQGARCMDCGVPFCHNGCPSITSSGLERSGPSRGRWKDANPRAALDQHFPEFTGRICRRRASGLRCSVSNDRRSRQTNRKDGCRRAFEGRLDRARAAAVPHRQARCVVDRPAGWRRASNWRVQP